MEYERIFEMMRRERNSEDLTDLNDSEIEQELMKAENRLRVLTALISLREKKKLEMKKKRCPLCKKWD